MRIVFRFKDATLDERHCKDHLAGYLCCYLPQTLLYKTNAAVHKAFFSIVEHSVDLASYHGKTVDSFRPAVRASKIEKVLKSQQVETYMVRDQAFISFCY